MKSAIQSYSHNRDCVPLSNYIRWCCLFIFLCGSQLLYSQSTISGKLISTTEEVPAFANVLLLLEKDSSFVKGAIADSSGVFQIKQSTPGDYFITVSIVGYESTDSESFTVDGNSDVILGEIVLAEELMQEVVVAALRPLYEQQIDRMVINVNNSITSAGGNALEVLARSPGVEVNEVNNVLSINGKAGVQILINGKLSRLPMSAIIDMLRGMDANNINQIELYDTPPAFLDAEGNAGVINILLKENKELGTNGSYSVNAGYGRRFKYGGSLNLNHRTEKLNIYGGYTYSHRFFQDLYLFDRTIVQNANLINTDSENDRDGNYKRHSAKVGLDYNIGQNTVLGFLASGYLSESESTSDNISTFSQNEIPFSIIENVNSEESSKLYGLLNLNLVHQLKETQSISFDIDYLQYENDNPSSYLNDFLDGEKNVLSTSDIRITSSTPINNISSKIDYNNNLTDKISYQLGIKGTSSRFENEVEVNEFLAGNLIRLEDFSQNYNLEENIGAAYGSLDYQLSETTKLNFGLRYEYTDYLLTTPDDPDFLDQNYGYFFPSFFLSKKVNETDQFQFSYSRRISRPGFNDLAPFVTFIDPNTFFIGNPALQPGISNNLKTSYKFKTILVSLQYSYSQDPILTYQPVLDPETNTQFYTTLNLDEEHSGSISILVPLNPTPWWNIQNKFSGNLERIILHEEARDVNLDTKAFSINMVNTFQLPKQFSLELAGQYKSAAYYGLLEVQPRGYLNIGIQKRFANGTLRLNCSDLFQTNIWTSESNIPELNLESDLVVGVETRIVMLSYAANFGKSTVKGKRRRSTSSEEQQWRIR